MIFSKNVLPKITRSVQFCAHLAFLFSVLTSYREVAMLGMISVLRSKVEASSAKELFKDSVRIPLESLCRYMSGVRIPTKEIKWFWKSFVIFSNSFKIRLEFFREFFRNSFENSFRILMDLFLHIFFWNYFGILLEFFWNAFGMLSEL